MYTESKRNVIDCENMAHTQSLALTDKYVSLTKEQPDVDVGTDITEVHARLYKGTILVHTPYSTSISKYEE